MQNKRLIFSILILAIVLPIATFQSRDLVRGFLKEANILKATSELSPSLESVSEYNGDESPERTKEANLSGPLQFDPSQIDETQNLSGGLSTQEVIEEINKQRQKNNLSTLLDASLLSETSRAKLDDMFLKGYFEHLSPEDKSIEDIAAEYGYDYLLIGENLALGDFKSSKAIVDAWMRSQPHKENILNPEYTEIGVSLREDLYNGHKALLAVVHFGRPVSDCPKVLKADRDNIESMQSSLKILKDEVDSLKEAVDAEADSQQANLFGMMATEHAIPQLNLDPTDPADDKQKLNWEKEFLGLYVSAHPLSEYQDKIRDIVVPVNDVIQGNNEELREQALRVAGVITSVKKIITKKGEPMVFARIEDATSGVEVLVFPTILRDNQEVWAEDKVIMMNCRLSDKDGETKLICNHVRELHPENVQGVIDTLDQLMIGEVLFI